MPRAGLETAQNSVHPDGKFVTRILGDSGTRFPMLLPISRCSCKKGKQRTGLRYLHNELGKSEMFGEKMILRTCVNLAINGKPSELLVKAIGGNIVEGSGALDARPETRGHA